MCVFITAVPIYTRKLRRNLQLGLCCKIKFRIEWSEDNYNRSCLGLSMTFLFISKFAP